MKKTSKLFAGILALTILALSSCANNSSDPSSDIGFDDSALQEGAIAVYTDTIKESVMESPITGKTNIYFYSDNTFLIHIYAYNKVSAKGLSIKTTMDYDFAKGEYIGDPTSDGTFKARFLKQIDKSTLDETIENETMKQTTEQYIKNPNTSLISISFTNEELPLLESTDESYETITISERKMYIPKEPHHYIRSK